MHPLNKFWIEKSGWSTWECPNISDLQTVKKAIYENPEEIKKFDPNFYYPSWVGYFEGLEYVIEIPC